MTFGGLGVTVNTLTLTDATHLTVNVNGQQFTGAPSTIVLKNLEEIALVIGTPPSTIPKAFPTA